MAMERCHWIAASRLPASASFPSSPWEQRHRDELDFRHGLPPSLPPLPADADPLPFSRQIHLEPTFELSSIRESELVSKSLYALQGNPVAVHELELLSRLFSHQIADGSLHRISSLWHKSASTKAIGKLLADMAQAGGIRMQLEEFVDFFLKPPRQDINLEHFVAGYGSPPLCNTKVKRSGKAKIKLPQQACVSNEALHLSPPYSLVNQAYARAVKTILHGHSAALNTLKASVIFRRSRESCSSVSEGLDDRVGPLIGDQSKMTLLELFLHTNALRVQLHVLAAVCLTGINLKDQAKEEFEENGIWLINVAYPDFDLLSSSSCMDFSKFPKGADLLSYLYKRLQEADTGNIELLRFLFASACQPYLSFIQSWLYRAAVKDPYKEFFVVGTLGTADTNTQGTKNDSHLISSKMQSSLSIPCFLEGIYSPLLRAGQQLQILLRLAETGIAEISHKFERSTADGFGLLKNALNCWTEFASEDSMYFPGLVFSKKKLLSLVKERRKKHDALMEYFDSLFSSFHSQTGGSGLFRVLNIDKQNVYDIRPMVLETPDQSKNHDMKHLLTEECKKDVPQDHTVKSQEVVTSLVSKWSNDHPGNGMGTDNCKDSKQENDLFNSLNEEESTQQNFSATKQRKRWEEPVNIVILHDQAEEEILSERKLSNFLLYPFEYEAETDIIHGRRSQVDDLNLSCSGDLKYHGYGFPPFETAESFLKLLQQNSSEDEMSSRLLQLRSESSASFFFPNVHPDKMNSGEYFGRLFIHKLAQNYNFSSMSKDGGYRKTIVNFDMISRVFLNFEDCITSEASYHKVPPTIPATKNSDTVQEPGWYTENVHIVYADTSYNTVTKGTVQKLSESSMGNETSTVDSNFMVESKMEPSVKRIDDMVLGMVIVDDAVEVEKKSLQKNNISSGGATWETYLTGNRGKPDSEAILYRGDISGDPDIPLEVIVDYCIIQEILSQYQCISYLSVRMLHEVFGLQEHFVALRRYFFMERGDWADMFVSALYDHVWHAAGNQQRQLEVQSFLAAAIQNSSCEHDQYAERLHVSINAQSGDRHFQLDRDVPVHIFVNRTSVLAFDFIKLEYNVEWPVNSIITLESIKIYNSIFSFLIRAKLAVNAVKDIWQLMKVDADGIVCSKKQGSSAILRKENFQIQQTLMLLRQSMSHFIMTFQGYIESQLLHNIWTKFLRVLHEEGKDVQRMELMHNMYLQDASHVCFLSSETRSIGSYIDTIMQCLLDLRSCLYYLANREDDGRPDIRSAKVTSAVMEVKNRYESSIRQLRRISQNSCVELPLGCFWTWLDFNGFHGDNIPCK